MPPRIKPEAELAGRLVQALRERKGQGEGAYPVTLTRLTAEAVAGADDALIAKALKQKTFTSAVVRASKKDPGSPVALAEDGDLLAGSRLLLEHLLEQVCTPAAPLVEAGKLVKKVDKPLQKLLADRIAGPLPDTVGSTTVKKKRHLYLQRMPPAKSPEEVLSEKLVRLLGEFKERGPSAYPPRLFDFVSRIGGDDLAHFDHALKSEPFASRAVLASTATMEAPVALAEDRELLVSSRALLEFALLRACTPKKRAVPVADAARPLAPGLRDEFVRSVEARVRDGDLPDSIGILDKAGRTLLYRTALPPDLGPLLAAGILTELRQRRQRGTDYPTTATELSRTVKPSASADAVVKALADRSIKGQVMAAARDRDAPVALKEDGALLAASPRLIEFALERARTDFDQAVNAASLKRKVPKELQADFAASLDQCLGVNALPAGIGALRVKQAWHLFFLRDVQGAT